MHRTHRLNDWSLALLLVCNVAGCIGRPPVAELLDEPDEMVVGTPGSISYPDEKEPSTDDSEADTDALPATGCNRDDHCKGDRVCIAGTCVSPQYAEEYEARYMVAAGLKNVEADTESPIIEVLVPPPSNRKLKCTPKKMKRCVKRCERGDAENCYAVGHIYQNKGDSPDAAQFTLYAYGKACEKGHALSCVLLSEIYFSGIIVERNLNMAFSLNMDACELENMYACLNAAVFLENGIGVEANLELASQYYANACIYGHDPSCAKARPTDESFF